MIFPQMHFSSFKSFSSKLWHLLEVRTMTSYRTAVSILLTLTLLSMSPCLSVSLPSLCLFLSVSLACSLFLSFLTIFLSFCLYFFLSLFPSFSSFLLSFITVSPALFLVLSLTSEPWENQQNWTFFIPLLWANWKMWRQRSAKMN